MKKARRRDPSVATCAQEVALITDYVSGQMKPARRDAFAAHLHACPDCAAFLQTYKKTIELTRSFLRIRSSHARAFNLTLRP
ncbi:MAG TPA: zf-HC2 domain-containing protein [Candidatus Binatia bacterium]